MVKSARFRIKGTCVDLVLVTENPALKLLVIPAMVRVPVISPELVAVD